MARLRYIADNIRGPRGGHNDVRTLFSAEWSAKRNLDDGGRVLQVDLDDLLIIDANADATFQWHDARAIYHATEMLRMREAGGGSLPVAQWLTSVDIATLADAAAEWDYEEDKLRRGGGDTPAARRVHFLLRDLLRAGKLARAAQKGSTR